MDVDPLTRNQEEVYVGNQQVNLVGTCTGNDLDLVANNQHTPADDIVKQSGHLEDHVAPQTVDNTKEMDNPEVNEPHVTTGVVAGVNSEDDVAPQTVDNTKEMDNPEVNEPLVTTGVVAGVNSEEGQQEGASESFTGDSTQDSQTQADDPTEGNSEKDIHSDVPSLTPLSCAAEPLPTPKSTRAGGSFPV
ncbi:predicted protein [Arabidopsis lyrata subsp. lyrata]|uniref:Predicted protein n=1 Tax=Arabidopsis lyrata subsp. lyrata TaxID=81972 RepID=D7LCR4_ARALL|nr:predicted protein [Arabidopsis lyrata subsp. lyrata]